MSGIPNDNIIVFTNIFVWPEQTSQWNILLSRENKVICFNIRGHRDTPLHKYSMEIRIIVLF